MALDAQWSAVARGYRLALILAGVLGIASIVAAILLGYGLAGAFICAGLALGGWNSRRLWTDTQLITTGAAEAGDRVRGPALTASAKRLGLITLIAFLVALAYRDLGWTIFLGLLGFQVVLISCVGPPLKQVVAPKPGHTRAPKPAKAETQPAQEAPPVQGTPSAGQPDEPAPVAAGSSS